MEPKEPMFPTAEDRAQRRELDDNFMQLAEAEPTAARGKLVHHERNNTEYGTRERMIKNESIKDLDNFYNKTGISMPISGDAVARFNKGKKPVYRRADE